MTITEVIDSAPATSPQANNQECISNNYQTIFKKALESTLSYGRPRNVTNLIKESIKDINIK
jgi:hypothetical protein